MSAFRPDEVLRILHEHRVRFVLIGGLAATLHGSAHPTSKEAAGRDKDRVTLPLLRALRDRLHRDRTHQP